MRTTALVLTAMIAVTSPILAVEASAQVTRAEELPGNSPIKAYSIQQRTYLRGYVQKREIPSMDYSGQLAVGTQVPSSYTYYDIDGDPALVGYRYTRLNNRYIVVDQNGRIIDVLE